MPHEALIHHLRSLVPYVFTQLIDENPTSEALQAAYDSYFSGESNYLDNRRSFGIVCLALLAKEGDAFPDTYQDALVYPFHHPHAGFLRGTALYHELFTTLAEPRHSELLELLYQTSLRGVLNAHMDLKDTPRRAATSME